MPDKPLHFSFQTPPPRLWRLLDANANRAREGLRVLEESARFLWEDARQARSCRRLRHRLDALCRAHRGRMLQNRAVEKDPGRRNDHGRYRQGLPGLLAANFKRVEESLRVLEEYGRLISVKAPDQFQRLRFEVYRLEKRWEIIAGRENR